MFDVTIILYIYLFIIIMLILFNIAYALREKVLVKTNKIKYDKYYEKIKQLEIDGEIKYDLLHLKFLKKELKKINNLLIYYNVINDIKEENHTFCTNYLLTYNEIFIYIIKTYQKKESIQKAYIAYFISQIYPFEKIKSDIIDEAMLEYIKDKSIYARENAMLYFYKRGSAQLIITALKIISAHNFYYNKKLLSNDMLKITGSKKQLIMGLLDNFNDFSLDIQIAIINYSRYTSQDLCQIYYEMLISKKYDPEIELALIRYFGKHPYPKVLPYLLNMLEDKTLDNDNYRIVITQILQNYDEKIVRDILIDCISDANWYVRKNATNALAKMKLTRKDINRINEINDRYGKEMVSYSLEKNIEKGQDKVCTN